MHPLGELVFLSLATSAISVTISKAKVFKSLRARIKVAWPWLGELVSCPYCTSHWVAFAMVSLYRPVPMSCGIGVVDLFVSALAIVTLAAFCSGLIFRALEATPE